MSANAGGRRDSGIGVVGDLPWGSHFCQFYATPEDMTDIVVPYFRAGLAGRELCIWVTTDMTPDAALSTLSRGIAGASDLVAQGQMQVFPHTEWYLKGGSFDLRRTLDLWRGKLDEAQARGFAGVRVAGSPHWIDNKKDWDDFAAYEAEINRMIHGRRLLVLCAYSLAKCGVAEILDVVRNHEFALARNRGAWQVLSLSEPSGETVGAHG